MATLYFNNAVNDQWDTLGNWWTDSDCTIPAASLPGGGDDVVVADGAYANSFASLGTAANVTVGPGAGLAGDFSISGMATFNGSAFEQGYLSGNATFNAGGNFGQIGGNATFNNSSNSGGAAVEGNATFNGSSSNGGFVYGDATFNDSSSNNSPVGGDATFNDSSYNSATGTITGTETYASRTPYPIPRGINGSSILGVI